MRQIHFPILVLAAWITAAGCGKQKPDRQEEQNAVVITSGEQEAGPPANVGAAGEFAFFRATGTEPFWGLYISERFISLFSLEDTVQVPYTEPSKAMDANIKRYRTETEAVEMNIIVRQETCTNAMSGKVSPYTAGIEYRYSGSEQFRQLEGCGNYTVDTRLHDIWAIESLRGSDIPETGYDRQRPYLEINSGENSFVGYAGCNNMNGTIFFEPGVLRFTNVVTTRKMCPPGNIEMDFLSALQGVTAYRLGNNRLTLMQGDREIMVFRKVD